MSDQNPNDTPPTETPTESPTETQAETQSQSQTSSSNPMQMVVDTIGNVWSKGSGSGLTVKGSDGQAMFMLPINLIVLLLLALLIGFVPAVIILVIAGLVAQFVYKASFSFGKFDQDAS